MTRHALSGFDASFFAAETSATPMHTLKVLTLSLPAGTRCPREHARQALARAVRALPVLRCRPRERGLRRPVWEEVEVDLDAHVSAETLWPGRSLERALADFVEPRLPRDRPLWAAHILDAPRASAVRIAIKYHHSLSDGLGSGRALERLAGSPAPRPRPAPSRSARGLWSLLVATVVGLLRSLRFPQAAPFASAGEPYDADVDAGRRVGLASLSLAAVRAAKEGEPATVNDVLLTLVALALRRLEPGRAFDRPLVAAQPVGLPGADHDRGNFLSSMLVPVHVEQGDPRDCLRRTAASTRAAKAAHAARGPELIMRWTDVLPSWALRLAWRVIARVPRPPAHLVVSTIRGADRPLRLGEATLEAVHLVGPLLPTTGLNVTFWTHADAIHVTVLGTHRVAAGALAAEIERALEALAPAARPAMERAA